MRNELLPLAFINPTGDLERPTRETTMDHSFYVWTFILIGNAAAVVLLSLSTAGGTSSMGNGPRENLPPRF